MFKRISALIKKEFLAIWKDPKSRTLIIIPPLMQLFIFANALTMEVKNIDMAVLDRSNSVESRELLAEFAHSKWFRKIIYVNNEKEADKKLAIQKVQMILEINNDFAPKIKANKPVEVQILVDGRQTNSAAIAGSYATKIISGYELQHFSKTQNGNINGKAKKGGGAMIDPVIRNWFNPNLEFQWFLLVSLISILSLVITLLLTALSIARERELGTFDQLIVSPLGSFEILAGKTIPPLIISIILTCFMTTMALVFFKVPFVGSVFWFFLSTVIALLAIVGIGLFISSLCKTQQQAILGVFTFQMPAVLLSGFISPIEDMPVFLQHITLLNPIRFYMTITKGIFFKGMLPHDIMLNLIPLVLTAVLTLSLAGWMFRRKLE